MGDERDEAALREVSDILFKIGVLLWLAVLTCAMPSRAAEAAGAAGARQHQGEHMIAEGFNLPEDRRKGLAAKLGRELPEKERIETIGALDTYWLSYLLGCDQ